MAARVLSESAIRVSDCVTELLRKQPFFGSLVLRLPLRPDPTRETLATDGHEIRYSPRWIAETEAHLIETAMARVVMACSLKHHTRRGERDPERWQMASQLVTHALIRDAGFTLPPDAEAWDDLSVEQAYDRLPEPGDDDSGDDGDASSDAGSSGASADAQSSPDGDDDDTGDPSDTTDDGDGQDQDGADGDPDQGDGDGQGQDSNGQGEDAASDAPPSHDPSGTGEVMDAGTRAGEDGDESGGTPLDVAAEEQAWDEAMHQALNIARAEGKAPGRVDQAGRRRDAEPRRERPACVEEEGPAVPAHQVERAAGEQHDLRGADMRQRPGDLGVPPSVDEQQVARERHALQRAAAGTGLAHPQGDGACGRPAGDGGGRPLRPQRAGRRGPGHDRGRHRAARHPPCRALEVHGHGQPLRRAASGQAQRRGAARPHPGEDVTRRGRHPERRAAGWIHAGRDCIGQGNRRTFPVRAPGEVRIPKTVIVRNNAWRPGGRRKAAAPRQLLLFSRKPL